MTWKKHGAFGWNELMTTDIDAAKEFYSQVIGWTAADVSMGNPSEPAKPGEPAYTIWLNGDKEAGGAMKIDGPEMKGVPPHWLSYVNVEDVDAAAKKATELGGKVLAGPIDVKSIGRFFIIQDPQGAVLGLGSSTMEEKS